MSSAHQVDTVRPEEVKSAFRLMYQNERPSERLHLVTESLKLLLGGELKHENILVIRGSTDLLGMVVWSLNQGGGQIWPPQVRGDSDKGALEDALLQAALSHMKKENATFVQSLLLPEEITLESSLLRNGFTRVTTLLTMEHDLHLPKKETTSFPNGWHFHSFSDELRNCFEQTIEQTYEGSLDFPEMYGFRDMHQILEGHKYQGQFDPHFWLLAEYQKQIAGVLLLTEIPDWQEWELSYLGVVPEFRGQGVGRILTRKAIQMAQNTSAKQLIVIVDKRNEPACKLYAGQGFVLQNQKAVYFLKLGMEESLFTT